MLELKALILNQILKQEKPFKAARIYHPLGISRQACYYHLIQLVDSGGLEKNGTYFAIADKEFLLDQLTTFSEASRVRPMKATKIYPAADKLTTKIDYVYALSKLGHPVARELKEGLIEDIDKTIKEFKNARKYLVTSERNPKKLLGKEEEVWRELEGRLAPLTSKESFMSTLETILIERYEKK